MCSVLVKVSSPCNLCRTLSNEYPKFTYDLITPSVTLPNYRTHDNSPYPFVPTLLPLPYYQTIHTTHLTNTPRQISQHTTNNTQLITHLINCTLTHPITFHPGSSLTVSSESVGRAAMFLQGGLNNGGSGKPSSSSLPIATGRSPVPSHRSGHDASGGVSSTYNGHGNTNTSNQNYPPQPWQQQQQQQYQPQPQQQQQYPISVPTGPNHPMEIEHQPPILPTQHHQQQPKKRSVD